MSNEWKKISFLIMVQGTISIYDHHQFSFNILSRYSKSPCKGIFRVSGVSPGEIRSFRMPAIGITDFSER